MKPRNELSDNRTVGNPSAIELVVGELWYIRFEDNKLLIPMHITDVTEKTVSLDWIYEVDVNKAGRFIKCEILFVEKCVDPAHLERLASWEDEKVVRGDDR